MGMTKGGGPVLEGIGAIEKCTHRVITIHGDQFLGKEPHSIGGGTFLEMTCHPWRHGWGIKQVLQWPVAVIRQVEVGEWRFGESPGEVPASLPIPQKETAISDDLIGKPVTLFERGSEESWTGMVGGVDANFIQLDAGVHRRWFPLVSISHLRWGHYDKKR